MALLPIPDVALLIGAAVRGGAVRVPDCAVAFRAAIVAESIASAAMTMPRNLIPLKRESVVFVEFIFLTVGSMLEMFIAIIAAYFVPEPDDGVSGCWTSSEAPEPTGTVILSEAVGTLSEVVDELHPAATRKNAPKTTSDESF